MFGIGTGELLLILVIAMVVFGPERMVELAGEIGRMLAKLREETDEVTREFREIQDSFSLEGGESAGSKRSVGKAKAGDVTTQRTSGASEEEKVAEEAPGTKESAPEKGVVGGGEDEEQEAADEEEPASKDSEDVEPVDIEVGEFVPPDEEAEPTELDLPVAVTEQDVSDTDKES